MSEQNSTEMTFQIQRIYTKDISLKRRTRRKFSRKTGSRKLNLIWIPPPPSWLKAFMKWCCVVTVTAALGEETAFLCEVQQGGIFSIDGIEGTQMAHCLGAYCPNILFPYARECITSRFPRYLPAT